MYSDIQVIIMAGGVGRRFWSMSTPDYPKQFIDVMGVGCSLILFSFFSKKVYQLEIERLNAEYINIESRPKLVVMTKEDVAAKLNEN